MLRMVLFVRSGKTREEKVRVAVNNKFILKTNFYQSFFIKLS